jgi:hypothetical protein
MVLQQRVVLVLRVVSEVQFQSEDLLEEMV